MEWIFISLFSFGFLWLSFALGYIMMNDYIVITAYKEEK